MELTKADLRKARLTASMTTVKMAGFANVRTRKTYENWENLKQPSFPGYNQMIWMLTGAGYDVKKVFMMLGKRKSISEPLDWSDALKGASNG